MESYAVIGAVVVGVGAAIVVALLLVSRAMRRRERLKALDPDSVEAMRLAQKEGAEQKLRNTDPKFGDSGGDYYAGGGS